VICIAGGRFSAEKGQIYLVRAAVEALRRDSRLAFILFGDGPDLDSIRRAIDAAGQSERILCPGFENNLVGCIKGADILINPSLSEGLPNIVLEAMALQVPVIATSVGGVPELITDGESGILVGPRDAADLSAAILKLAAAPDKRQILADHGREVVNASFSFQKQCRELIAVYRTVLSQAGART